MPENDSPLTIETPGDTLVTTTALNTDGDSPELAALKTENAQLRATVELLNQQLMDIADGQATAQRPAEPKEPRLIGEDWSTMTAAEAHAKGCTQRVLCRDGYYIPA
jgi:hypothetical protein